LFVVPASRKSLPLIRFAHQRPSNVCLRIYVRNNRSSQLSVPIVVGSKEKREAEDLILQVKDVSCDVSKWCASCLGNSGIKDLGHVPCGIPKLRTKREREREREKGEREGDRSKGA